MDSLQPIAIPSPPDLLSQWLGGPANLGGFLRTSLDLSTREGIAAATRFSGESKHDNSKIDGQDFVITGYAIKAVQDTDEETGEVNMYPRVCLAVRDGTHLVFCGRVALESILFLAAGIKPEEWKAGVKVRVHAFKNKFKTLSHRLELLP